MAKGRAISAGPWLIGYPNMPFMTNSQPTKSQVTTLQLVNLTTTTPTPLSLHPSTILPLSLSLSFSLSFLQCTMHMQEAVYVTARGVKVTDGWRESSKRGGPLTLTLQPQPTPAIVFSLPQKCPSPQLNAPVPPFPLSAHREVTRVREHKNVNKQERVAPFRGNC